MVKQDVFHVHNTVNNVILQKEDVQAAAEFIQKADTFVRVGDYAKAIPLYDKAINADPANYRGYMGLVEAMTIGFTRFEYVEGGLVRDLGLGDYINKSMKVANQTEQELIRRQCFVIKRGVLTRYIGNEIFLTIPDNVVAIGGAFHGNRRVVTVEIPDTVVEIESYSFANCKNLTCVNIPSSVTGIGNNSFENCTAYKNPLRIPESVINVGAQAFAGWTKQQKIMVNKKRAKKWNKKWKKDCKAKISWY